MKVLQISASRATGAFRAVTRINDALNQYGVSSSILTEEDIKKSVLQLPYLLFAKIYRKKLFNEIVSDDIFWGDDVFGFNPYLIGSVRDADIIHLHWVDFGLVGRNTLIGLGKLHKPIVWTMHDMRSFTGLCHYDNGCNGYKYGCSECPILHGNYAAHNILKDSKIYNELNLTMVGCSRWITQCAQESACLSGITCVNIPNCIDTDFFSPYDKLEARLKLSIKTSKKIVLFGAESSTSNKRKGYNYLVDAIKGLDPNLFCCAVFGSDVIENINGIDVINLGIIKDNEMLKYAYACADVFVAPSTQENLANTVLESMSCGTPVVAFNIGGMPDMIDNKINGYLATPFDPEDLTSGIVFCSNRKECSIAARQKVINSFKYEKVAEAYKQLYDIINLNYSRFSLRNR